MATRRVFRVLACVVLFLIPALSLIDPASAQDAPSNQLTYHQLTNRTTGLNSLGIPILSGSGRSAVYAESAAQALDPEDPARIFSIDPASGTTTQVDTYEALCFCQSWVDITDEGAIVSTDSVQIRVGATTTGKQLLKLDSNEISGFKVNGDGSEIFFTLRRDVTMDGGKKTLTRGVYAIPISGGTPRQIVGPDAIAAALNVPLADMPGVLHGNFDHNLLDVTTDGGLVAFAAFAGAGEYVFTVPGGGGVPDVIAGPYPVMTHAAISGDGTTLAWGMTREQSYDVGVLRNGKATELLGIYNETYQPLQLSADGRWLLVGTDGSLYDTDTLTSRPLATQDPDSSQPIALLNMGVDRVTMSSDATHFLYVFTQPHLSAFEQLATIGLGSDPAGDAPFVRDVRIDPKEIAIDGSKTAKATVSLVWNGQLTGLGIVAIYLGERDPNIAGGARIFDADGDLVQLSEVRQGSEGIFTADQIYYSSQVLRDDDTGPRTLRVYAEIRGDDGRYHATAIDFGTLTVVETTAAPTEP